MEDFLADVCTTEWNERQDAGRSFADGAPIMPRHPDKAHLIRAFGDRFDEMIPGAIDGMVEILPISSARRSALRAHQLVGRDFPRSASAFPFLSWFDGIVVSGEEGLIKPDPRIFRRPADRYAIDAARGRIHRRRSRQCRGRARARNPRHPLSTRRRPSGRAAPRSGFSENGHRHGRFLPDRRRLHRSRSTPRNIAAHPRARLRFVVDLDAGAARRLADLTGAAVASLDEALATIPPRRRRDLDAAAQPCRAHRARRVAPGKAIFCEKPIDLDLAKVDACGVALLRAGVPFFVGFNRRFDPTHAALEKAIRAGEIGKVEMLVVSSRDPEISPPDYVAAMPYGIFYDTMIHDFDIACWLTGSHPVEVFARAAVVLGRGHQSAPRPRYGHGDPHHGRRRLVHVNSSFRAVMATISELKLSAPAVF